ncbi:unnamed protein product [Sphagnum balticum]
MATALSIVQQAFPNVNKVVDATEDSVIEVTRRDTSSATVRNHKACAMAVACKRKLKLDGVIMSISTAYLIKGDTATRYLVPTAVGREITAFDRNAAFEPGEYRLKAAPETAKLGGVRGTIPAKSGRANGNLSKRFRHKTEGIRASLGSKGAV